MFRGESQTSGQDGRRDAGPLLPSQPSFLPGPSLSVCRPGPTANKSPCRPTPHGGCWVHKQPLICPSRPLVGSSQRVLPSGQEDSEEATVLMTPWDLGWRDQRFVRIARSVRSHSSRMISAVSYLSSLEPHPAPSPNDMELTCTAFWAAGPGQACGGVTGAGATSVTSSRPPPPRAWS